MHIISDENFSLIEGFLPAKRRPPDISHRQALNGILFVLSSGCSWRQLPRDYGNWHTVYTRFKRWAESGVFGKILHELHKQKVLDYHLIMLDSTVVRAHHCASGAQRKRGLSRSADRVAD